MAARGEDFGDAGRREPFGRHAKRGAQTCAARSHHNGVVLVIDEWIRIRHQSGASARQVTEVRGGPDGGVREPDNQQMGDRSLAMLVMVFESGSCSHI